MENQILRVAVKKDWQAQSIGHSFTAYGPRLIHSHKEPANEQRCARYAAPPLERISTGVNRGGIPNELKV